MIHSLPIVFVAWIATLFTLKLVFRKEFSEGNASARDVKALSKMNEKDAITDMKTLKKILLVLVIVVFLFFIHHVIHISPSMVAIIGASLALLLVSATKDPQKIFERIELSVLVFFGALFVIVG